MTATLTAPHTQPAPLADVADADRPGRVPASLTLTVRGGFDAAHRVSAMLRSRAYDVRRLALDVTADGQHSRVSAHLSVPAGQQSLLRARLEKLPCVLDVTVTGT